MSRMAFFKRLKERGTKPEASISLALDKYSYSLGEELAGKLSLTSKDEFDIDEIKVVVSCVAFIDKPATQTTVSFGSHGSTVKQKHGTTRSFDVPWSTHVTLSNAVHFPVGQKQEFPFTLKLPENCTSAKGTIRKIKWSLKGVAVVNKRFDISSKEVQFTVANPNQTRV